MTMTRSSWPWRIACASARVRVTSCATEEGTGCSSMTVFGSATSCISEIRRLSVTLISSLIDSLFCSVCVMTSVEALIFNAQFWRFEARQYSTALKLSVVAADKSVWNCNYLNYQPSSLFRMNILRGSVAWLILFRVLEGS